VNRGAAWAQERAPWLRVVAVVAAFLLWSALARGGADALRKECELGIARALAGESARAESVFISLLSHSPGDPRALTNLGNLHLLRGDPEVALAFYERALAADTSDAGIILNQATALTLLGEEAAAEERARRGVGLAGGAAPAASLLGLRYVVPDGAAARGAAETPLSKEEVLEMLRAAAGRVPVDSVAVPEKADARPAKRRTLLLRSAGPRASEALAPPTLVYWKR
jgi:tetratricopeptide (TPR) repeat protein